ncbi:hypothetical protein G9464_08740 [Halostella sp. JP-L12]|uniref:hypothetical protein n=1 Tax=Halostella TaxID=1843185 RepID=UPI000EF83E27|nr:MULTISPECIES: hypothetical protein [Halostella]NHN47683.1 hypothetical protein [Halostella sp. JP-L12]
MSTPEETPDELRRWRRRDLRRWFLLSGSRNRVAAVVVVAFLASITALRLLDVVAVTNPDSVTRSLSNFIGGNITLITIVISINQLIISREFGTPDEVRERVDEMLDYQEEVEEHALGDAVSPTTPGDFLDFLTDVKRDRAIAFRDAVADCSDEVRADVDRFVDSVVQQADIATETIESEEYGSFDTLLTIMEIDYSDDIRTVRKLRRDHGDDFPTDAAEDLDEMLDLLEDVGVARKYFKTLYMQRELADLSKKLLYTGVPAITAALVSVWIYGENLGPMLNTPFLEIAIFLLTAIAFLPITVLFAYVLRIATVTRGTASTVPFNVQNGGPL